MLWIALRDKRQRLLPEPPLLLAPRGLPLLAPKVALGTGDQEDTLGPEEKTGRGWGRIRPLGADQQARRGCSARKKPEKEIGGTEGETAV